MADYNLSVTAADLNTAITKANAAAPQSTTYTKTEVDTALAGKQAVLTTAQQNAVDSGITSAKVQQYDNKADISDIYGRGTAISGSDSEHEDLNNYTTYGRYYVAGSTSAGYIDNSPVTDTGYLLTVESSSQQGGVIQKIYVFKSNTPKIYIRMKIWSSDTWSWTSWRELDTSALA